MAAVGRWCWVAFSAERPTNLDNSSRCGRCLFRHYHIALSCSRALGDGSIRLKNLLQRAVNSKTKTNPNVLSVPDFESFVNRSDLFTSFALLLPVQRAGMMEI